MRRLLLSWVVLFGLLGSPFAMDFNEPDSRFDPKSLNRSEKVLLQAALTLSRDYYVNLDGIWGPKSANALKIYYERRENITNARYIPNWAVMLLLTETIIEFRLNDWGEFHFNDSNMSFFGPDIKLVEEKSVSFYKGTSTGLELLYTNSNKTQMRKFHSAARSHGIELAKIRNGKYWITYLQRGNGIHFIQSRRSGARWTTLSVEAEKEDIGRLNLLSATVREGRPGLISVSRRFSRLTDRFLEKLEEEERRENARAGKPDAADQSPTEEKPGPSSGTGFAVSQEGHLLTNAHVVRACEKLQVNGYPASVVASDDQFDLALVLVPDLPVKNTAKFASAPASLNSDITVAGFPLSRLLGGLNVTRGSVTSLKGLAGNGVNMQISAPVQPGNSGGPAVNALGAIVGVVVAKLNAAEVANAIGDIPQNVNFAIRGTIAQLFLHQNGITPQKTTNDTRLRPEKLASQLRGYTHLIKCN
jgi:serine protease Do